MIPSLVCHLLGVARLCTYACMYLCMCVKCASSTIHSPLTCGAQNVQTQQFNTNRKHVSGCGSHMSVLPQMSALLLRLQEGQCSTSLAARPNFSLSCGGRRSTLSSTVRSYHIELAALCTEVKTVSLLPPHDNEKQSLVVRLL